MTWRRLPAHVVLAVPGSTTPLQLNATGAAIWDLLPEPSDTAWLTGQLAALFGRAEAEIRPAVDELLDALLTAGAVVQG